MIRQISKALISVVAISSMSLAFGGSLTGKVAIDGSSTVFPISEAVAEEYREVEPKVKVNIGVSGTGGGFKKFTVGDLDIADASRHIKDSEKEKAMKNNIKYMEVPVAFDGLTVVINKENTWARTMTVAQLQKLWDTGSTVKTWKDIDPSWPDRKINLYGPGTDSGTFDYFTETINGKSGKSRADFQKSEDDNVLVSGVMGDKDALGYFGFAYYQEHTDKLVAVAVDGGKGPVAPTLETINTGTYAPLSRPIFIYVNLDSYNKKPEVASFVDFYLKNAGKLSKAVGYVDLPNEKYEESLKNLKSSMKMSKSN